MAYCFSPSSYRVFAFFFLFGINSLEISSFQLNKLAVRLRNEAQIELNKQYISSLFAFGTSAQKSSSALLSSLKPIETRSINTAAHPDKDSSSGKVIGTVGFLIPKDAKKVPSKFGSLSPYGNPSIFEAVEQLARKTHWFSDGTINVKIITVPDSNDNKSSNVRDDLINMDALIVIGIRDEKEIGFARDIFNDRKDKHFNCDKRCQFSLDCGTEFSPVVGPYDSLSPSVSSKLFPWTNAASGRRMEEQMSGLFERWTSDDFTVALMLFFNQFSGSEIDWVKHSIDATWEKGPIKNAQEFYSMVTKCGDCVVKCVGDEKCKECLDALTAVDTRDQVASYRTVVSYESELLKDFSFCILQKNNIFGCDAKIPSLPIVKPLESWRGNKVTSDVARSILIGHLDDEASPEGGKKLDISWKVAAGANVAYDQFPSQNQIFYESVNGKAMWYDPVFRVETIDGRNVWCKRHYRVRDGKIPGTFRFSVLDNGVTSEEFWTVVAVADDLSWIVFHYAGAAGAVGQRYLGGLLCTATGELPPEPVREYIWGKLRAAGIEPWELFVVDNDTESQGSIDAGPPPLDFFRKDVLAAKIASK